jgi:AbrB family looped-hinge helix DNA binding protein
VEQGVTTQRISARIGEKGRIVIPASIRRELGVEIGDQVDLRVEDKELRVSTLKARLERAQESVRRYIKPGRLLSDELSAERREAAERE